MDKTLAFLRACTFASPFSAMFPAELQGHEHLRLNARTRPLRPTRRASGTVKASMFRLDGDPARAEQLLQNPRT